MSAHEELRRAWPVRVQNTQGGGHGSGEALAHLDSRRSRDSSGSHPTVALEDLTDDEARDAGSVGAPGGGYERVVEEMMEFKRQIQGVLRAAGLPDDDTACASRVPDPFAHPLRPVSISQRPLLGLCAAGARYRRVAQPVRGPCFSVAGQRPTKPRVCRPGQELDAKLLAQLRDLLTHAEKVSVHMLLMAPMCPMTKVLRHRAALGDAHPCSHFRSRWIKILAGLHLSAAQEVRGGSSLQPRGRVLCHAPAGCIAAHTYKHSTGWCCEGTT